MMKYSCNDTERQNILENCQRKVY